MFSSCLQPVVMKLSSLHEAKLTPKHPKKHSPKPVGELLPLKKS